MSDERRTVANTGVPHDEWITPETWSDERREGVPHNVGELRIGHNYVAIKPDENRENTGVIVAAGENVRGFREAVVYDAATSFVFRNGEEKLHLIRVDDIKGFYATTPTTSL